MKKIYTILAVMFVTLFISRVVRADMDNDTSANDDGSMQSSEVQSGPVTPVESQPVETGYYNNVIVGSSANGTTTDESTTTEATTTEAITTEATTTEPVIVPVSAQVLWREKVNLYIPVAECFDNAFNNFYYNKGVDLYAPCWTLYEVYLNEVNQLATTTIQ